MLHGCASAHLPSISLGEGVHSAQFRIRQHVSLALSLSLLSLLSSVRLPSCSHPNKSACLPVYCTCLHSLRLGPDGTRSAYVQATPLPICIYLTGRSVGRPY